MKYSKEEVIDLLKCKIRAIESESFFYDRAIELLKESDMQ